MYRPYIQCIIKSFPAPIEKKVSSSETSEVKEDEKTFIVSNDKTVKVLEDMDNLLCASLLNETETLYTNLDMLADNFLNSYENMHKGFFHIFGEKYIIINQRRYNYIYDEYSGLYQIETSKDITEDMRQMLLTLRQSRSISQLKYPKFPFLKPHLYPELVEYLEKGFLFTMVIIPILYPSLVIPYYIIHLLLNCPSYIKDKKIDHWPISQIHKVIFFAGDMYKIFERMDMNLGNYINNIQGLDLLDIIIQVDYMINILFEYGCKAYFHDPEIDLAIKYINPIVMTYTNPNNPIDQIQLVRKVNLYIINFDVDTTLKPDIYFKNMGISCEEKDEHIHLFLQNIRTPPFNDIINKLFDNSFFDNNALTLLQNSNYLTEKISLRTLKDIFY